MYKTIIFDFNGTLYFDQDLNIQSWEEIYKEIIGNLDGFKTRIENILATKDDTNIKEFFKIINKHNIDDKTIEMYVHKKEELYQACAKANKRNELATGAKALLDYLKSNGYEMILATASIKYNVDFYMEYCGLATWFNYKHIAYDDGINQNKKEIYLDAIKKANTDPQHILAFDDSYGSIQSAIDAGIKNIIRISHYKYKHHPSNCIIQEIDNFKEFDYSILKK